MDPIASTANHSEVASPVSESISIGTLSTRATLICEVVCVILACIYIYLFWHSVSEYWFNPNWTTDDAVQQWFPFHRVQNPQLFQNDIIYEVMKGYLPPLHWALGYVITCITGDLLMSAHVLMFIQVVLTCILLAMAIRGACGKTWLIPGMLAVCWFLHSRPVVQRMTAGLPRAWSAVVICAFFAALLNQRWRWVLGVLLLGCISHPPSTLILAGTYFLFLSWSWLVNERSKYWQKQLIEFFLICPICLVLVLWVVHRPESIGQMVTLEQAEQMPEFLKPKGRFPFLPFLTIYQELQTFAFEAFVSRFADSILPFIKSQIVEVGFLISLLVAVICFFRAKYRQLVPSSLWFYLFSVLTVYLLSRALAFRLYVPNRHLQLPMAFFFILTLTIFFWKIFERPWQGKSINYLQIFSVSSLAVFIYLGTQSGLQGNMNFNYHKLRRGPVFEWIKKNTEPLALFAGEPTFIDPLQLFGERAAYVTSETSHPFYVKYNDIMRQRLRNTFSAHYATNAKDFLEVLEPEGVRYFIFSREKFFPDRLRRATYFKPHDQLVKTLTDQPIEAFLFTKISKSYEQKADQKDSFVIYKDRSALVVDVAKLKSFLLTNTSGELN